MTDMERKTFCAALSRYGAQAQITMAFYVRGGNYCPACGAKMDGGADNA